MVFLEQNRIMERAGWMVAPFCMEHENNADSMWKRYFVNEIEFGKNYSLAEKITKAANIIYSWESKKKISDCAMELRPDIAHAHNVYHHISPSIFSSLKKLNIPTVLTLHDLKIACPAYKMLSTDGICERCKGGHLWNVIRKRCIKDSVSLSSVVFFESLINNMLGSYSKNIDKFVVPSMFYLNKFVEWGWRREKFVYIPNFVDVEAYIPDDKIGKAFVYFGRLGPEKGVATLIRAASKVNVPLRIVGTGPEEKSLRSLVRSLDADVEFLGYKVAPDLHDAIRSARAVVLPSEWYENAPISILEAYALGRPVIGSRIGGIPELIREGQTGSVFTAGDIDELAAVLRRYVEFPDSQLAEMGQEARNWVEVDFTFIKYRERLFSLYRDLGVDC